jgi:hypothetical protein
MAATITGDKALDKKLSRLGDKAAARVTKKAIGKAGRTILKGMKAKVPSRLKDAKKALGFRFDKKGGANKDQVRAKVGAAVGVKKGAIEKQKAARAKKGKKTSFFISARNIQWFLLGTQRRTRKRIGGFLAGKSKSSNATTGIMPPQMSAVREGYAATEGAAKAVLIQTLKEGIATEAKQ